MKSTDLEFLATGICPAPCIRLSPDRLERPTLTACRIPPNRMPAAFPVKLATMSAQMPLSSARFQAITNSSRRVGSCSFSASSRLASRTI